MPQPDTPVFDRSRDGQRISAERRDEPGREDLFVEDELDDDGVRISRNAGQQEDSLYHPERQDTGRVLVWNPAPPRG